MKRPTKTPAVTSARLADGRTVLKTTVTPSVDEHALTRAIHGAVCEAMRVSGLVGREVGVVVTLEEAGA